MQMENILLYFQNQTSLDIPTELSTHLGTYNTRSVLTILS